MRPVLAPFLSMMVLMPIVLPWIAEEISADESSVIALIPSRTPLDRSSGVVRTFRNLIAPVPGSNSMRSVKVPPMSTPRRRPAPVMGRTLPEPLY